MDMIFFHHMPQKTDRVHVREQSETHRQKRKETLNASSFFSPSKKVDLQAHSKISTNKTTSVPGSIKIDIKQKFSIFNTLINLKKN